MARGTSQLTGFARFLIFLIIATPLIFFGVTYYKGEDPIQTLQNAFAGKTEVSVVEPESPKTATAPQPSKTEVNSELAKLRDKMEFTEKRNTELYKENEELKSELEKKEAKLKAVQKQLDKIKSAIGQ